MESGTTLDNDARWIFEEKLVTPTNSNSSTSIALWYIRGLFGNETRWTLRKSLVVDRLFVRRIIRRFCWPKNVWLSWESWEESRTNFGEGDSSLKEFACGLFEKSSDRCASSFPNPTSRLSREQRFQTFVPATRIWNKIGYLYTNEFLTANKFRLFRSCLF